MTNKEIADLLRQIARMLEIKGETVYKSLAYRRAAESIEALGQGVEEIWREKKLRTIPGIGPALAKKLDELLSTGRLTYYEKLKEEVPPGVTALLDIPGVGPKTAALFLEQGLLTVADVEAAAREGRLRHLPGMGERAEQKILEGIEAVGRRSSRVLLGTAWPIAQELIAQLRGAVSLEHIETAGSLRRMSPTIGDIDLLAAATDTAAVADAFAHLPLVASVIAQGPTKVSVMLHAGLQVDLRVVQPRHWGSALQYFTGSRAHNVRLREMAQKRGLSLSEYGFKRDAEEISCPTESEVYQLLGLPWIPPELREDRGELEAACEGRLPRLVSMADLRGDLHMHTDWSDGLSSVEEMIRAASTFGYDYIAISDHSEGLTIANGQSWERLQAQRRQIAQWQAQYPKLRILQGVEVEIRLDGTLDFADEMLAQLDIVIASLHSGLRQDEAQITARAIQAMRNPHVDILAHPSGRILGQREASAVNLEALIQAAAETGTILEVNSIPNRLDLDDVHIRRAIEQGVQIVINSDAHSAPSLSAIGYGIATARRGWATPSDVVNTLPLPALQERLTRKAARGKGTAGGE